MVLVVERPLTLEEELQWFSHKLDNLLPLDNLFSIEPELTPTQVVVVLI